METKLARISQMSRESRFVHRIEMILFKWLNRRSQRRSYTWENFREMRKNYPLAKKDARWDLWGTDFARGLSTRL